MHNKNTLWIGSEYYYPEFNYATAYFLTGISESLTDQYNVNVICSSPHVKDNTPLYFETHNGVNIYRIKEIDLDKNKILQRIFRFVILSIRFLFFFLKNVKSTDTLVVVTNPAPIVFVAAFIKKLRKCNLFIIVHDVFPENLVATKLIKETSISYKFLLRLFNSAYRQADKLITCGRDMEEHFNLKIKNYQGTVCFIPNWGDSENIFPNKEIGFEVLKDLNIQDKFVFQFAGNIGRAQGVLNILEAASKLINTRAHFLFFGDGVYSNEVKKLSLTLNNVTHGDTFARLNSNKYLNACDVAIVSLLEGMVGLGVPSKTYDNLAAGKPILFIGEKESEIARIIEEEKIGIVVKPNSPEDIVAAVNYFIHLEEAEFFEMNLRVRKVLEEKYSKKNVLKIYQDLFQI